MRERITTMSAFSREFLETTSSWSEVLAAVFATLAAFSGIAYLLSTRPLRKIEARENTILEEKRATAQKEAAEAQLALKQYVDLIAARAEPRGLDLQKFLEHLKGKPRGTADIWYKPEDAEAYLFAGQIGRWLGTGVNGDGAGWNVSKPKPIPLGGDSTIPSELKYGGSSGLTVRGNKPAREFGENTAIGALMEALLWGRRGGGVMVFIGDNTLPDDHFIIIVGQQQ